MVVVSTRARVASIIEVGRGKVRMCSVVFRFGRGQGVFAKESAFD